MKDNSPQKYPKWVTSPSVGPVIVRNAAQEEAVISGKALFSYTKTADEGHSDRYEFIGLKG